MRNENVSLEMPATPTAIQEGNPPVDPTDTPMAQPGRATSSPSRVRWLLDVVNWKPAWCRWDINRPPKFSLAHNFLFGFAGAFTVANLYYNHPILNILARDFDVSYVTISRIPTLMQAGYATGLLFLCPLGDVFPRRPFTLTLVFCTATMW